jgi:hypothetical protein
LKRDRAFLDAGKPELACEVLVHVRKEMPACEPKAFEDLKQVKAFSKIQLASVHKSLVSSFWLPSTNDDCKLQQHSCRLCETATVASFASPLPRGTDIHPVWTSGQRLNSASKSQQQ